MLLCEQTFRDVWSRNESVRAEIGQIKHSVKLLALAIPYSGNHNIRYDTVFTIGPFNINKSPFRCPYVVTPFRVVGRGKTSRKIACIGHSLLWEP